MAVLRLEIEDHGQLMMKDAARDTAGEDGICLMPQFRKRAIPQLAAEEVAETCAGKAEERGVLSLVGEDEKIAQVMLQLCGIDVLASRGRSLAAQFIPIGIYVQSGHALHSISPCSFLGHHVHPNVCILRCSDFRANSIC
ncbi:hypothetical protein D3C86_1412750 [compost metagenome]